MIAIKNVLVATDFSQPSANALEYGRALARTFAATLYVLHVVDSTVLTTPALDAGPIYDPELMKRLEDEARERLETIVREDDRRELHAKTVAMLVAGPANGIVGYAAREKVDLIVIGTHGRTGLSHLLMGSVAERVVRTAPCPVLTVRAAEQEFVVPDAIVAQAEART
jgi:nucleotide-binding universal stress UspA family protein